MPIDRIQRILGDALSLGSLVLYASAGLARRYADTFLVPEQRPEYLRDRVRDLEAEVAFLITELDAAQAEIRRLESGGVEQDRRKAEEIEESIFPIKRINCATCMDDPKGELFDMDGFAGYRRCTICNRYRDDDIPF